MFRRSFLVSLALLAFFVAAAAPQPAHAQSSCNTPLSIQATAAFNGVAKGYERFAASMALAGNYLNCSQKELLRKQVNAQFAASQFALDAIYRSLYARGTASAKSCIASAYDAAQARMISARNQRQ